MKILVEFNGAVSLGTPAVPDGKSPCGYMQFRPGVKNYLEFENLISFNIVPESDPGS